MHIRGLINSYSRFVAEVNRTPGMVDVKEAKELIEMADEVNSINGSCYGKGNKGDRHLHRLIHEHNDRFDNESQNVINYWLAHHHLPHGYAN